MRPHPILAAAAGAVAALMAVGLVGCATAPSWTDQPIADQIEPVGIAGNQWIFPDGSSILVEATILNFERNGEPELRQYIGCEIIAGEIAFLDTRHDRFLDLDEYELNVTPAGCEG